MGCRRGAELKELRERDLKRSSATQIAYFTVAVSPVGAFGLEPCTDEYKYAPASHAPLDGRGTIGIAGEIATYPPLPACSIAPIVVPLHSEESSEKVEHKLVRFAPAPIVAPPTVGW